MDGLPVPSNGLEATPDAGVGTQPSPANMELPGQGMPVRYHSNTNSEINITFWDHFHRIRQPCTLSQGSHSAITFNTRLLTIKRLLPS